MFGALAGDIIGSVYEWNRIKTKNFPLFAKDCFFTDDSILTVALAESILDGRDYGEVMKEYYFRYPGGGYGGSFHRWAQSLDSQPYNSWGNGAAMRISPVGYVSDSLEETLELAAHYTGITHNHPEGIKGGEATAMAIFLARQGASREEIKAAIAARTGYDLDRALDDIRPTYSFNESCQETVPQALIAFFESTDFEDAIRNAISLGGDSDTLACITGSIAEAYYGGAPRFIRDRVYEILDAPLRGIVNRFIRKHVPFYSTE